jgi:hypothetical protein
MIPNILGNLTLQINLSGEEILSDNISVVSIKNTTLKTTASRMIYEKENDLKNFKKEIEKYSGIIQRRLIQVLI